MASVIKIEQQTITFSSGNALEVPWSLTPRMADDGIKLILDGTTRVLEYGFDVTRKQLILGINTLLIAGWQKDGRKPKDKPKLLGDDA